MTASGAGYYGSEYDRYLDRFDDSPLNRIKQHYWTAKQAVRSKFGKKEDEHLIASDSELDAKLATFYSVKNTCEGMLRCIERYQDYICELSQEENSLGRFLKHTGKTDKTQAGKMMAAVGRSQSFAAQQRLALRVPLVRLYQELDVFTERAVADCYCTVEAAERARTEYRGSLLWMKKVSEQLDPDTYRQMEKFRKVQAAVRRNKAKFDKLKLDCLQKVDLLAASRCNLFSQLMANYQNCLLNFWDRTSKAHNAVSENFKGYQHFEFVILKDLAEPSRRLAELTAGTPNKVDTEVDQSKSDEELILLAEDNPEDSQLMQSDSIEQMLFMDSPVNEKKDLTSIGGSSILEGFDIGTPCMPMTDKGSAEVPRLPPPPGWSATSTDAVLADFGEKNDADLFSDLMGTTTNDVDSFAYQWQHAFGDQNQAGPATTTTPSGAPVISTQDSPLHGSKPTVVPGFLPSQLLDNPPMSTKPVPTVPTAAKATPTVPSKANKQTNEQTKDEKMASWYNLFADLDPLKNAGDDINPC